MNRHKAQRLIERAVETLKDRFPKMEVKAGRCVFTTGGVTLKIQVSEIGEDGTAMNREVTDYKRWEKILGLPPLGTTFLARGVAYVTAGYRHRARKRPIFAFRKDDGKMFCFPSDFVLKAEKVEVKK